MNSLLSRFASRLPVTSTVIPSTPVTTSTSISSLSTLFTRLIHSPIRIRGSGPRPVRQTKLRIVARKRAERAKARKAIEAEAAHWEVPNTDVPVVHFESQVSIDTVSLNRQVWCVDTTRTHVVNDVVNWQRACARRGMHKTKDRGEVSGTGRKPHPQKGTGRARQGTKRAPHHKGGGVAQGTQPRDHGYDMPITSRQTALKIVLSAKFAQKQLTVIQQSTLSTHKTEYLQQLLEKINLPRFLMVHNEGELDPNLALAGRALEFVDFISVKDLNVISVLRAPHLIITRDALDIVEHQLGPKDTKRYLVGTNGGGYSADEVEWVATKFTTLAGEEVETVVVKPIGTSTTANETAATS